MSVKKNIGEVLVSMKLISSEQLDEALIIQEKKGDELGNVLYLLGYINEENQVKVLAIEHGLEYVPADVLSQMEVDERLLGRVPQKVCDKYGFLPIGYKAETSTLYLCANRKHSDESIAEIIKATGVKSLQVSLGSPKAIDDAIQENYKQVKKEATADKDTDQGETTAKTEETDEGFYLGSDDESMMFPGIYRDDGKDGEEETEDTKVEFGTLDGDLEKRYEDDLPEDVEFGTIDGELAPAEEEMAFPGIYNDPDANVEEVFHEKDGGAHAGQSAAVTGRIEEMSVPDIVQILGAGKKTRAVIIENDEGRAGVIHIEDGKVVNAFYGDLDGEEAFYEIVIWATGKFSIETEFEITDRPIATSNDWLIMEALRLFDEKSVGR